MKKILTLFLLTILTKGYGQCTLKLYYADTSKVVFTFEDDEADTIYVPKYLRADDSMYLNDTTITEIYGDKDLQKQLLTRINCKGDSVYLKYFYSNGKLKRFDIKGKILPEWFYGELYYDNGQLRVKYDMHASMEAPQFITNYWSNGKKLTEFWYYAGILINEYLEWYENGTLKTKGNYSSKDFENRKYGKSIEDGKWSYWKEDGSIDKTVTYEEGIIK